MGKAATVRSRREKRRRDLELVPSDLVFEQTGGRCDFCGSAVDPGRGWMKLDGEAWLGDRLLWTEVKLAHQWCFDADASRKNRKSK